MPVAASLRRLILLVLVLSFVAGCASRRPAPVDSRDGYAPAPEGYYRIRNGDTLYRIAVRHKMDYKRLAQWNSIEPPYRIYAGRLLRVAPPGATIGGKGLAEKVAKRAPKQPAVAAGQTSKALVERPSKAGSSATRLSWRWPLEGRVAQTFRRGDRTRQGIRIAGRAGQPVVAAEDGKIVYSGSGLKGYGNLIIIKHNQDYISAYGFNRRLMVEEGEQVKRGQRVAELGQLSAGQYVLHFEIRKDGVAVDPLKYLPIRR